MTSSSHGVSHGPVFQSHSRISGLLPLEIYHSLGLKGLTKLCVPVSFDRDNFLELDVYFEEMQVTHIKQRQAYDQESLFGTYIVKARLHMRFFMRFCVQNLPQPAPTGFWSRNAETKYRQISRNRKEGCLQIICENFHFNPRDASRKKHSCRVG